jgi:hypothetical protein
MVRSSLNLNILNLIYYYIIERKSRNLVGGEAKNVSYLLKMREISLRLFLAQTDTE